MEILSTRNAGLNPEYRTPSAYIKAEGRSIGLVAEGYGEIHNEDAFFILPDKKAYGVMDGVGGEPAGDAAANITRDLCAKSLSTLRDDSSEAVVNRLDDLLLFINDHIRRLRHVVSGASGTTASVVCIINHSGETKAVIATIGDSRVYRKRAGNLEQLSRDDRVIQSTPELDEKYAQLKRKINAANNNSVELDEEEQAFLKGYRKGISHFIGQKNPQIAIEVHDFLPEDKLLICTDGLSDNLTDAEISDGMDKGCSQLVEDTYKRSIDEINPNRKIDDITGVLLEQTDSQIKEASSERMTNTKNRGDRVRNRVFVKARNDDGNIEDKWLVDRLDLQTNQVVLVKKVGKQIVERNVPEQEFTELNSVPKITCVYEAETEKELYAILRKIGHIRNKNTFYLSKQLIEQAKQVFAGKAQSSILTRAQGFRAAVEAIMASR